jgi:hypothetical protein
LHDRCVVFMRFYAFTSLICSDIQVMQTNE